MRRRMFLGKIHRATVTHADLDYEGSVTIDADLLDAAGMLEHEEVHILNVTRGSRLVTYTLRGPRGSGVICINGAAAHLAGVEDRVIICSYAHYSDAELDNHQPALVYLQEGNTVSHTSNAIPVQLA